MMPAGTTDYTDFTEKFRAKTADSEFTCQLSELEGATYSKSVQSVKSVVHPLLSMFKRTVLASPTA